MHNLKYGESSLIANIFTRDFGRQAYLVQGVRSKKGKFHFNQFQSLSLLELEVEHKPARELQRIRDLKLSIPLHHIQGDLIKNTIALFVGEVLYRSLRDTERNDALFEYLESAIQILDYCPEGSVNFHLIFLIHFTRFLGIFPQNQFELDNFQSGSQGLKLHELLPYTLKDLDKLKLSNELRNNLLHSIIDYYYYHLEGMGKISSLKVLHEVFS